MDIPNTVNIYSIMKVPDDWKDRIRIDKVRRATSIRTPEGGTGRATVIRVTAGVSPRGDCCMADPDPKVWLDEDGILHVQYPQNFNLMLDVMELVHQKRLGLIRNRRSPTLTGCERR
jgi:hypothetical protein